MSRLLLLLSLSVLVLDCIGNMIIGGSPMNTLSSEAWYARTHPYFGWTHKAINAAFFWQNNHCRGAAHREAVHGSAWAAWAARWAET